MAFHVETKLEYQQDPVFKNLRIADNSKVEPSDSPQNRERDSALTPNHCPHARSLSQKPESRRLKLDPYAASDIEAYES